ncbi:MAG TPA: dimethylamine monooxygenase subunit DmmA family protein [Steroidobacteraceae bacterium]|nr:dimethylamine monooxygenase subunit DmmA family protein [Steroidobacteraceae bacterium]
MLVTGIKSKPIYAPLLADAAGRYHLMLGHGVGGAPLERVLEELAASTPQALARTRVLYVADAGSVDGYGARFSARVRDVRQFGGVPELLADFRALLTTSLMGTRLYVAGPESFIGVAMRIALEFNLNKDEIRAEECGSLARRVYCIHCRATTENVRTNIAQCVACRRHLIVRDHYSRRFAAYMGVMADAEVPGELPPIKEVFA